jgi:hypothetical protein
MLLRPAWAGMFLFSLLSEPSQDPVQSLLHGLHTFFSQMWRNRGVRMVLLSSAEVMRLNGVVLWLSSKFASLPNFTASYYSVAYRPVAKRRLCKQRPLFGNGSVNTFPLLGSGFLILQQLHYNNGRAVFFLWSVPRCYMQGTRSVDSSVLYGNL